MLENVREYSEIVLCDREIETKTFQKLFSEHEQFMLKNITTEDTAGTWCWTGLQKAHKTETLQATQSIKIHFLK